MYYIPHDVIDLVKQVIVKNTKIIIFLQNKKNS